MSELETRLRDLLEAAAPDRPATDGLAAGARRYAVRARRVRIVTTAVLAVVTLAFGVVAADNFRDRALPPAHPVEHLSCEKAAGVAADAPRPDGGRRMAAQVREVLVCPDRSPESVWPGFLVEEVPVTGEDQLDYLSFGPRRSGERCAARPGGRSYRVLLLGRDGRVTAIDNTALSCNGWPALDRYQVALGDQASAARIEGLADPFPRCTSVLQQAVQPESGRPAALAKGTTFAEAVVCRHPLADPARKPQAGAQPIGRSVLGDRDLAVLNAELARRGSVKGQHRPCSGPLVEMVVIHGVTSEGRAVTLSQACPDDNQGLVNWAADDILELSPAMDELLAGLNP